ncbi:hypothetical protein FACS1894170_13110 [Planctomycetales bacterium]|nr:hypothetical protein FACS1894170_13110 [Planctomycetales bacterium]
MNGNKESRVVAVAVLRYNERSLILTLKMFRLGTVPYCNAFPLTHFIPELLPNAELSVWYPSEMRQELIAGRLDAVLMPVVELLQLPEAIIISNCAIACKGAVQSVRLMSRKPVEKIETLALDTASRSSVTICRVLLWHFYGISPPLTSLPLDVPLDSCRSDAFVVIGDRALGYQPSPQWQYQYDIGAFWEEKTGLPLVFAAWIGLKPLCENTGLITALEAARDKGLSQLETVIAEKQRAGAIFPVPSVAILDYYRNAIVYAIGESERSGLKLFLKLAKEYGMGSPLELFGNG